VLAARELTLTETRTYFPLPVLWQIKTFRDCVVEAVVVDAVVAVAAAPPMCLPLPWPLPGDGAAVDVDALVPAAVVPAAGAATAASSEPPWWGLPLPGGGLAIAIEATTPAANRARNRIFSFMSVVSRSGVC